MGSPQVGGELAHVQFVSGAVAGRQVPGEGWEVDQEGGAGGVRQSRGAFKFAAEELPFCAGPVQLCVICIEAFPGQGLDQGGGGFLVRERRHLVAVAVVLVRLPMLMPAGVLADAGRAFAVRCGRKSGRVL